LHDINTTNPLGHEGRLAQVTAMLINSLWKRFNIQSNDPTHHHRRITAPGSYALVTAPALTPKTFKESLSRFNEHFQGNEQQDAQELLAFLLGGLSEDLNRIVDKPYIEAPDSDGRPDNELADIWWSNHLKRELSIVVALFTGQYKSLLTCRTCKYESARFEPFSFLQVPLPEDDNLTVTLILYPIKENSCAMKYCVRVRNDGKLRDVLIAFAKVLHQDNLEEEKVSNNDTSSVPAETDNQTTNGGADDDGTEASNENNESIFIKRSQNFAVVDMRDGYISKIAPVRVNNFKTCLQR
jgi:Ubiquitin carboxyl-terminal hydrolase